MTHALSLARLATFLDQSVPDITEEIHIRQSFLNKPARTEILQLRQNIFHEGVLIFHEGPFLSLFYIKPLINAIHV